MTEAIPEPASTGETISSPEPAVAPEPRLEPTPADILRSERYGLYARLYLASLDPHDAPSYLNPNPDITVGIGALALDPSGERNYTDVTKNLSEGERRETWNEFIKEFSFEDAYEKWSGGVTKSIKTTTDKRIINAIKAIAGKDAADFTEEDVKTRLYNPFAKGKSDTTPFVGSVIGSYRIDGKVDVERLKADMEGIKWVASQLFGKKSSGLIVAAAELEAGMRIDGRKTIEILLQDTTTSRLNRLNEEEKTILAPLFESFPKPREEPDEGGAPLGPSEEDDEDKQGLTAQPAVPASATPQTRPELDDTLESGEKITTLSEKEKGPRKGQLRSILGTRNAEGYVPTSRPPEDLPGYLSSLLGNRFKSNGQVKVSEDGKTVIIRNVEVANAIPFAPHVRFDIRVSNNKYETGEITAEIVGEEPRFAKGHVGEDLKGLTGLVKQEYGELIEGLDRQVGGVLIRKGKLVVGFIPKTSIVTAAEPPT